MALTRQERQARYRERRRQRVQAPSLVAKVADPEIADAELTPMERAVRCVRLQVIDDLGGIGQLSAAKTMQVDAAIAAWVVCEYLQRDVLELAQAGALVNRRSRRTHPLVADWRQTLDSFTRLLRELGLSRVARAPRASNRPSGMRWRASPPGLHKRPRPRAGWTASRRARKGRIARLGETAGLEPTPRRPPTR